MSKIIKMHSDWWDHEAEIDGKTYVASVSHGGTNPNDSTYSARTSAVLAISCIDDGHTVVFPARTPANEATDSGAVSRRMTRAVSRANALWADSGRWFRDKRTQNREEAAWKALVRVYSICAADTGALEK